jgi:hypothetical protein
VLTYYRPASLRADIGCAPASAVAAQLTEIFIFKELVGYFSLELPGIL